MRAEKSSLSIRGRGQRLNGDRGEVASWLILAAGLAIAASFAAFGLGRILTSLTNDLADAAGVDVHVTNPIEEPVATNPDGGPGDGDPGDGDPGDGDPGDGDPGDGGPGDGDPGDGDPGDGDPGDGDPGDGDPGDGDPGDGDPGDSDPSGWTPENQEWFDSLTPAEQAEFCFNFGSGLPASVCDPNAPRDPADGVPDCFVEHDPSTHLACAPPCSDDYWAVACWTDTGCLQTSANHCHEDGTCTSFDPLGCSTSPEAHELLQLADLYESCIATPLTLRCVGQYSALDTMMDEYLEYKIGVSPGEYLRMAAELCDSGHPGCETAALMARLYHDQRAAVFTALLADKVIPSVAGVPCLLAPLDGSVDEEEVFSCMASFL